jgi:hypothetical protein
VRAAEQGYPKSTRIVPPSKSSGIFKQLNRSELNTSSHNHGYLGPNQSHSTPSDVERAKVQDSRPSHRKPQNMPNFCKMCHSIHAAGLCLSHNKKSNQCSNCRIAHSAYIRTCPNLCSEIQLRITLDKSRSDKNLPGVDALRAVLRLELARRTQRDTYQSVS